MCYMAGHTRAPRSKGHSPARSSASLARESTIAYGTSPHRTGITVGVRELRQNLSVYLDEVKQGQAYVVTEHGLPVALLRPMPLGTSALDRLVAEGRATAPRRPLPRPLDVSLETPLSQVIIDMRDEDPW